VLSLGIDVGTSGIRAVVMNKNHDILAEAQMPLPPSTPYHSSQSPSEQPPSLQKSIGYFQTPSDWWSVLQAVIKQLSEQLFTHHSLSLKDISHLAIDGTSGTVLLCDKQGTPISDALMYNDQRATEQAKLIKSYAPDETGAIGATSGLAKILWLYRKHNNNQIHYALNQSDWLTGLLTGVHGKSDSNNVIKMGYDAQNNCWPDWLLQLLEDSEIPNSVLPQVYTPGHIIDTIALPVAEQLGFSPDLKICAGTTDSTAAIMASGAKKVGDAVTSLGSTLVMKVVSEKPIYDINAGVYSQPFGKLWLVGGSSNSGGEVLKQFFKPTEISILTEKLDQQVKQNQFSMLNLNYYPLSSAGERFPIQDPYLEPRISPRPAEDIQFFQALLEGMADIESLAYRHLVDLGTPYPKHVKSIGGGALNQTWQAIREEKLGVPVKLADMEQAAAGTALLAQKALEE